MSRLGRFVYRVRKFPDFYDIKYLVNRANEQHNLNLDQAIIQKTSEALFQEVGNHLQVSCVSQKIEVIVEEDARLKVDNLLAMRCAG